MDRYNHLAAFANYIKGEDRRGLNLRSAQCEIEGSGALSARGMQSSTLAYVWVFYGPGGLSQPTLHVPAVPAGAILRVPGLRDGAYTVEFWDTFRVAPPTTTTASCTGNTLRITLPAVQNDVALKIKLKGEGK
jgi:hypothetical protein